MKAVLLITAIVACVASGYALVQAIELRGTPAEDEWSLLSMALSALAFLALETVRRDQA